MKTLDQAALLVLIIGGLNWLIIGLTRLDIFYLITGPMTAATRAVYIIIGLAAVYIAVAKYRKKAS